MEIALLVVAFWLCQLFHYLTSTLPYLAYKIFIDQIKLI